MPACSLPCSCHAAVSCSFERGPRPCWTLPSCSLTLLQCLLCCACRQAEHLFFGINHACPCGTHRCRCVLKDLADQNLCLPIGSALLLLLLSIFLLSKPASAAGGAADKHSSPGCILPGRQWPGMRCYHCRVAKVSWARLPFIEVTLTGWMHKPMLRGAACTQHSSITCSLTTQQHHMLPAHHTAAPLAPCTPHSSTTCSLHTTQQHHLLPCWAMACCLKAAAILWLCICAALTCIWGMRAAYEMSADVALQQCCIACSCACGEMRAACEEVTPIVL